MAVAADDRADPRLVGAREAAAECKSGYTRHDGVQLACPQCGHEWPADGDAEAAEDQLLQDGDTITVIKGLKMKARRGW